MRNSIKNQTFQATATHKGADTSIRGQRFGFLVAEHADATGKRITLRCDCGKLTYIAADMLASGAITSCGCRQPPQAYFRQQERLSKQLIHEMTFGIRHPRHEEKPGRKSS